MSSAVKIMLSTEVSGEPGPADGVDVLAAAQGRYFSRPASD